MKQIRSQIPLAIALVLVGALGATAVAAVTTLATVNGKVISLQEFDMRLREGAKYFQGKTPSKKFLLEEMIKREIGLQEARKAGLDKDPAVIDQQNTILYQAFVARKLGKELDAIHVTDDEAQDWYDRNPEIRTSHIFIAVRPGASEADRKAAYDRIKEIQVKYLNPGQMSFAEVAQKYSEGPQAAQGGDSNWQTRDHLDPTYYAAAVKLSVGGVSQIVKSPFGYHIIKLTGKHAWGDIDHAAIKRIVIDERRQKIYADFMEKLRNQASVQIHSELLKD